MHGQLSRWVRANPVAAWLLVLVCSALPRLFMTSRTDPANLLVIYSDAATYVAPAHALIEKHAYVDLHGQPTFHRTPGYPAFLAGLFLLVGPDLRKVLIAQAMVLSLGPVLLYWLASRMFPPAVALVGAVLAGLSPWGAVLAGIPISDGLFVFMLTAMLAMLHLAVSGRGRTAVAAAACVGVLTGLAVLVRPFSPLVVLTPLALLVCVGHKRSISWALGVVTLVCAVGPPAAWVTRNHREADFDGLTDVTSQTAWAYLAARVRADLAGESRYAVSKSAASEETAWGLPPHSAALDRERWTRAMTVFREHPFRTVRAFGASALEHTLHPSPDVLRAARLNFRGDIVVLGTAWGALLILAAVALWDLAKLLRRRPATLNERFLVVMVAICSILTLASGLSFGAGSRLRAPLEIVVPLLASAALFRWSSLPPLQPVLETVRARAHRPLGAWVEDLMSRTATVRRTAIS